MVTAEITITREDLLKFTQPMQYIGIDWETYDAISEELGNSSPIHLSYEKGILTVMPLTKLHETLVRLLERLLGIVSLVTRSEILPTGSATIRSKSRLIGVEPDLSFFVTNVDSARLKAFVPDETDLPPDIVVEIDITYTSEKKIDIYSQLGVPEFWLYDGEILKMFRLQDNDRYLQVERSSELPMLTSEELTEFLRRAQNDEEQFKLLVDFQELLQNAK
ncbi:MAG: Uma2 family endonuclease [Pyrinomonadaceae bacterium]